MDSVKFEPLVTHQDVEPLQRIPQLEDFVRESLRRILLREPEPSAISHATRRLRLRPFYTRRRFLQELLGSDEFLHLVLTQCALLEEHRQALNQRRLELEEAQEDHRRPRMDLDLHQLLQSKVNRQAEIDRN